ncbi:MAG: hypothetical protein ACYC7B_14350 [Burkholderiales bacterium]
MKTLKLAAFAVITAIAGAIAFASQSTVRPAEQVQGAANFQAIDNFLVDSRKYLDL